MHSMLLVSPPAIASFSVLPSNHHHHLSPTTRNGPPRPLPKAVVQCMANNESRGSGNSIIENMAIGAGLVSVPVIAWSLYTLKTTGCGLPPGPGGSIGTLEGLSYLAAVGIVGWSLYTKSKTGSGLPNGPFGMLGAVEGLSYLSVLAIVVVFGLQFAQQGFIPGPVPVPGDQCFG